MHKRLVIESEEVFAHYNLSVIILITST
eukprot:UN15304